VRNVQTVETMAQRPIVPTALVLKGHQLLDTRISGAEWGLGLKVIDEGGDRVA
jgi:hypothetical protein